MQIWQMRRPSSFCDPNVEFEARIMNILESTITSEFYYLI